MRTTHEARLPGRRRFEQTTGDRAAIGANVKVLEKVLAMTDDGGVAELLLRLGAVGRFGQAHLFD
jgi:hypothetical protein